MFSSLMTFVELLVPLTTDLFDEDFGLLCDILFAKKNYSSTSCASSSGFSPKNNLQHSIAEYFSSKSANCL